MVVKFIGAMKCFMIAIGINKMKTTAWVSKNSCGIWRPERVVIFPNCDCEQKAIRDRSRGNVPVDK